MRDFQEIFNYEGKEVINFRDVKLKFSQSQSKHYSTGTQALTFASVFCFVFTLFLFCFIFRQSFACALYTSSTDRGNLGIIENTEHLFMVNTHELASLCSLFEANRERKESSEDSVQQTFDLNIPKHEGLSGISSESAQKGAPFPQVESNRGIQKNIQSPE